MNKNTALKPTNKQSIPPIKDERKQKTTRHLLLSQRKSIKSKVRKIFSNKGSKVLTLKHIIAKNF